MTVGLAAGFAESRALAAGDDGARQPAAAKTKVSRKPNEKHARKAETKVPPVCRKHPREAAPPAPARGPMMEPFPGAGVMNRMMTHIDRNPATGFRDFLSAEEQAALKTISVGPEEERKIGRRFRDAFLANAKRKGYRVSDDEAKRAYLQALVDAFSVRMKHRQRYPKLEVTLIDAPIADGQSCPGGYLIFTTALLDAPDEATVAAVVAHELAHLDLGHIHEYARRDKLANSSFQGPMTGDFSQEFSRFAAAGSVLMNPFKPHHELEADCQAVTWLYEAGYDPTALADFFEAMHARQQDQPDNPFFQMMRSHPYTLDRRDHAVARLRQLQAWRRRDDLARYPENLRALQPREAR